MSAEAFGDDRTDAWLVDASRRLDEPSGDIARLIEAISDGRPRLRRPGRALATDDAAVQVNERVLKQLLATIVRAGTRRLVVQVDLAGDGTELTGVSIGLICRYGDDLRARGDQVREQVGQVLSQTLGPGVTDQARRSIRVRWQDLYTREWLS